MRKLDEQLVEDMISWYQSHEEKPTLRETATRFGISIDSVRHYLKSRDIEIPVGTRPGAKREPYKKTPVEDYPNCKKCGEKCKSPYSTFCSRECYHNYYEWPKCPCGKDLYRKHGPTYCSPECRQKYRQYKKVNRADNPDRWSICLGCGEEFSRPSWWPTDMKYCSNECAHREQKKGWGKIGLKYEDGSVLIFRSKYEMRFAAACERFGLEWRSYDGPAFETSYGNYRPDFIVVVDGEEKIIEVKGQVTQREIDKSQESKVPLFLYDDLVRFEETGVLSWSSTVLPTRDLLTL